VYEEHELVVLSYEVVQMFPPYSWTLRVTRVDWSFKKLHSL